MTLMEDLSAKMCVLVDSFVEETQNVLPGVMNQNASANLDSIWMAKIAEKLNVKVMMNAAMIKCVKIICVKLFAFLVNLVDLMPFVQLKITNKYVNVSQDLLVIQN